MQGKRTSHFSPARTQAVHAGFSHRQRNRGILLPSVHLCLASLAIQYMIRQWVILATSAPST